MSAPCRPIISGKNWGVITIKAASRDARDRSANHGIQYVDTANETSAAFSSNKCPSLRAIGINLQRTLVIDDSDSAVFEKLWIIFEQVSDIHRPSPLPEASLQFRRMTIEVSRLCFSTFRDNAEPRFSISDESCEPTFYERWQWPKWPRYVYTKI